MNIVLIGFMGIGKSAVGHKLARELGKDFLDTDSLVEKTSGRSISEIFKSDGEEHFRGLETTVLKTLQDYDNYVLSTGGGVVLRAENVTLLKTLGKIILLRAEPAVIFDRVKNEKHRPLLEVADPMSEIKKILGVREPLYRQAADFTVDTSKLSPDQAAGEIIKWLKLK